MRTASLLIALTLTACNFNLPRPDPDPDPDPNRDAGVADGGTDAGTGVIPGPKNGLFTAAVKEIIIEVDYQPNAEPYTGLNGAEDTWDLFKTNAAALFSEAPRTITVPTRLDQMERLTEVSGTDFTVSQILDIAARYRNQPSLPDRRSFYVLFLDGYFHNNQTRLSGVLGVSIGDTGVIAMFKPVIRSTGIGTSTVPRFVEQVTLTHEFGHAVGLVNNGVPLTSAHQDHAHGAHCSNQDCVMYYSVEGVSDLVSFIARRVQNSSTVLFGNECLQDTVAAAR